VNDKDKDLIWESFLQEKKKKEVKVRKGNIGQDKPDCINTGERVEKPKKGKGSYSRTEKHPKKIEEAQGDEGIRVKASSSWRDAHENEEDVVDSRPAEEETYEERGQRREGKGLLEALLPWIETARGEQLNEVYQSILKAYQAAGYPDAPQSGSGEIERDFSADELHDEPLRGPSDQEMYGYPGDR
jgi:hypothetical protein